MKYTKKWMVVPYQSKQQENIVVFFLFKYAMN